MSAKPFMLLGINEKEKLETVSLEILEDPNFRYDPISQTSNVIVMGESKPTTRSLVTSTGLLPQNDGDEQKDDTGTD